jgi:hypothetical protein
VHRNGACLQHCQHELLPDGATGADRKHSCASVATLLLLLLLLRCCCCCCCWLLLL